MSQTKCPINHCVLQEGEVLLEVNGLTVTGKANLR